MWPEFCSLLINYVKDIKSLKNISLNVLHLKSYTSSKYGQVICVPPLSKHEETTLKNLEGRAKHQRAGWHRHRWEQTKLLREVTTLLCSGASEVEPSPDQRQDSRVSVSAAGHWLFRLTSTLLNTTHVLIVSHFGQKRLLNVNLNVCVISGVTLKVNTVCTGEILRCDWLHDNMSHPRILLQFICCLMPLTVQT